VRTSTQGYGAKKSRAGPSGEIRLIHTTSPATTNISRPSTYVCIPLYPTTDETRAGLGLPRRKLPIAPARQLKGRKPEKGREKNGWPLGLRGAQLLLSLSHPWRRAPVFCHDLPVESHTITHNPPVRPYPIALGVAEHLRRHKEDRRTPGRSSTHTSTPLGPGRTVLSGARVRTRRRTGPGWSCERGMKRDDAHQPGKRRAGSRGRERGQQTAGPSVFGSPGWTFCTRG
jgi:hypothetical protein